ncbi:hypothetical protein EVG20_g3766 [Dentipellis fragilis]|uniref:Uncharacterized protein n=1 Tax=Dentipellis fragilis TaxID=205917 RepID=A0A4Y9YZT4_9AGAM|nr:hypothetical protein EVG20_g3766 [Dentipellis fragilis]
MPYFRPFAHDCTTALHGPALATRGPEDAPRRHRSTKPTCMDSSKRVTLSSQAQRDAHVGRQPPHASSRAYPSPRAMWPALSHESASRSHGTAPLPFDGTFAQTLYVQSWPVSRIRKNPPSVAGLFPRRAGLASWLGGGKHDGCVRAERRSIFVRCECRVVCVVLGPVRVLRYDVWAARVQAKLTVSPIVSLTTASLDDIKVGRAHWTDAGWRTRC